MAFSLRIGPMLVTADTAAEAAELVRALGIVAAESAKRPQGTGSIVETPSGWQISLRTGPGKRIHRGGFKSRADAETALTTLVDTGVAPPPKRHRRAPTPPANDPIADDLADEPAHAPIWPDWSRGALAVGESREGMPSAVAIAPPAVAAPAPPAEETPTAMSGEAGPIAAGGDEGAASTSEGAVDAPTSLEGPRKPEAVPGELAASRWLTKNALAHRLPPGPKPKNDLPSRRRAVRQEIAPNEPTAPAAAVRPVRTRASATAPTARAAAQLPPRCVRCIRVGHVEGDCPSAAPAPTRDSPTCAESQTDPSCLTDDRPVVAIDLDDDDEGTDLTDLVDVPDAEPTVFPVDEANSADFNRGRSCGNCGKTGHISVTCPVSSGVPAERATHVPAPPPVYQFTVIPPRTRGDCLSMPRPCPFVVCRHHLSPERPGVPLAELTETCTLDMADRGPVTLEEVGQAFGLTRERIRQVETKGIERAARYARRHRLDFDLPVEAGSNAPEDAL